MISRNSSVLRLRACRGGSSLLRPAHAVFAARAQSSLSNIRNLGIIAHIDAGKTTTSEYMLYLCGDIASVGRVDNGDTVMDFLPQERERGITIGSAAISMPWGNCKLNLIDTPGHVDFTVEVERSCRVLDGVVVIVDAVSGVQAQTRTVWKQSNRQNLPAIAFVNKMDRDGASFIRALDSIQSKLGIPTLAMQMPLFKSDDYFYGYVDLMTMDKHEWLDLRAPEYQTYLTEMQHLKGKQNLYPHRVSPLDPIEDAQVWQLAVEERAAMLDTIAGEDEHFMEYFLDAGEEVHVHDERAQAEVLGAIRRLCHERAIVPAFCGASLRGKGVESLLGAITALLPSPLERPPATAVALQGSRVSERPRGQAKKNQDHLVKEVHPEDKALCALAFKVVHDKARGPLVYVRNYSGNLMSRQVIWNATKGVKERVNQLLLVSGGDLDGVDIIGAGEVACLVGLKHTETGDTLVEPKGPLHSYVLDGLTVPKAVFSLVIEPERSSHQTELEDALRILTIEDPSLVYEIDEESGQNVIRGIGELHLEIVLDKLKRQFGLEVFTGKAYVAYRESLDKEQGTVKKRQLYDRTIGMKRLFAAVTMEIVPAGDSSDPDVIVEPAVITALSGADEVDALLTCIRGALRRGPRGYPIAGVTVRVLDVERDGDTTSGAIQACAAIAVGQLMSGPSCVLLEPVMALEVEVPSRFVGDTLNDLTVTRRAHIHQINSMEDEEGSADISTITANVPLGTMLGYATSIRSITQGEGSFSMEFLEYSGPVDENVVQEILKG